ncbi:MAG: hypothetical protein ABJQ71_20860 [Roseibium sp.]
MQVLFSDMSVIVLSLPLFAIALLFGVYTLIKVDSRQELSGTRKSLSPRK